MHIMTNNVQVILASSSPYRRELLERLHVPFTCVSPDVDETPCPNETPRDLALRLSKLKAFAIAQMYPGQIIIGSDQVLCLDGKSLGKPHTYEKAKEQLMTMSGKSVVFHSGICIVAPDGSYELDEVQTTLFIRNLSEEAIDTYLKLEEPFDCAGSAKIEKLGISLIREYQSTDPTAIIGLPLIRVSEMLAKVGVSPLSTILK